MTALLGWWMELSVAVQVAVASVAYFVVVTPLASLVGRMLRRRTPPLAEEARGKREGRAA